MQKNLKSLKADNSYRDKIISFLDNSDELKWINDIDDYLDSDLYQIFILALNNKFIGYAVVKTVFDEAELYQIFIDKDHRKQGFGTKFLEDIIRFLKNYGIKTLFLEVNENNIGARKLYDHSGFLLNRMRENYYNNNEDALEMKLEI